MRLPICVSTQTHTLVQALRVPRTSSWLFTIRTKPTYYRLVVDGDQRLPERPANVCQLGSISRLSVWYTWNPARAVRGARTDKATLFTAKSEQAARDSPK